MDYRGDRVNVRAVIVFACLIQVIKSCEIETVLKALETCREERTQLNNIAPRQDSNQSHICAVFEAFAHCMDPQVGDCQGETTEAFRRQKEIYTGPLYNCTVWSSSRSIHSSELLLSLPLFTAIFYTYL